MSELQFLRLALFAGEMFVGAGLVMTAAWLAAGNGAASRRHLVWSAAFGALLLLPMLAAATQGAFVITLPAPPAADATPADAVAVEAIPASVMPAVATTASLAAPPPASTIELDSGAIAQALFALWAAGVVFFALRGLIAVALLRSMLRDSTEAPFEPGEVPELASGRRFRLRVSNAEHGPVTWGVLRPVVLLPRQSLFWPSERLEAVLRHELAHVRRFDSLSQVLSLTACALYWPNPLVWLGLKAQRRLAEMAADDAVLASGMAASDYAGELLKVAAEFRLRPLPAALSMAAPSSLPARVRSVLSSTQQRSGVTAMDILKMAGLALVTTGALVAARPSLAQDAPPPPPAVPMAAAAPTDTPALADAAAPADVPAPPAPPAPASAPTPPTPPAPPAIHVDPNVRIVRITQDRHHRRVRIVTDGRADDVNVEAELARVKPEMDRAMAEIKAHEVEIRRIQDMRPQINAEIARALAEARAQVASIDDAKIRAKVDAALARAQKRIEESGSDMDVRGNVDEDGSDDETKDDSK
jgi:beta-lactamase regulating signal transducer with metallopeptidase domain